MLDKLSAGHAGFQAPPVWVTATGYLGVRANSRPRTPKQGSFGKQQLTLIYMPVDSTDAIFVDVFITLNICLFIP